MTLALYLLVSIFSTSQAEDNNYLLIPESEVYYQDGKFYGNEKGLGTLYFKEFKIEEKLSSKYFRGEYLVYDCEAKHFVCINQKSYEQCQNRLNEALVKRGPSKRCLPIKKFVNQRECFENHYLLQVKSRMSLFCEN